MDEVGGGGVVVKPWRMRSEGYSTWSVYLFVQDYSRTMLLQMVWNIGMLDRMFKRLLLSVGSRSRMFRDSLVSSDSLLKEWWCF